MLLLTKWSNGILSFIRSNFIIFLSLAFVFVVLVSVAVNLSFALRSFNMSLPVNHPFASTMPTVTPSASHRTANDTQSNYTTILSRSQRPPRLRTYRHLYVTHRTPAERGKEREEKSKQGTCTPRHTTTLGSAELCLRHYLRFPKQTSIRKRI